MTKLMKLHSPLPEYCALTAILVCLLVPVAGFCQDKPASSELFLTLQREKQALEQKLAQGQEDLQARDKQIAALQAQQQASAAKTASVAEKLQDAAARIVELEDKLTRAQRRATSLEADVEAEVARTKAYGDALAEFKMLLTRQQDAVGAQREQVSMLESRGQKLRAEAAAAAAAKQVAMQEVEKLTGQVQVERAVIDAERVDMHYNLAVVYTKNRLYREAEREYLKCLDIDPDDADVHYNLGILYEEHLNDDLRALKQYEKFVRLRPDSPETPQVKRWIDELVER